MRTWDLTPSVGHAESRAIDRGKRDTRTRWQEENYPDEFKRDAVTLYRDTEGATITQIAADLGVSGVTLSAWCKAAGVPIRHRNPTPAIEGGAGVETPDQELARLRAENRVLRANETRLSAERDILWSAAKYLAEETNW